MIVTLEEELNLHYTLEQLKRIALIWELPKKPKNKKKLVELLLLAINDSYYVKNILEKLTPLQYAIYSMLIQAKNALTLGEISKKIRLQPLNVEKELAVLKVLMLVYQRKNRERITSNLDKYYTFKEIANKVILETSSSKLFKVSIKSLLRKKDINLLNAQYKKILLTTLQDIEIACTSEETFDKILKHLSSQELLLIDEIFNNGGILEINLVRNLLEDNKMPVESTLKKLEEFYVCRDLYYVDERFVRVLVIPEEFFLYLTKKPIFIVSKAIKQTKERTLCNEYDFIINLKKLVLFISKKGINLAQSETVKQVDMKKSEMSFIELDLNLFKEKSQIFQVDIILPILKVFNLVSIKSNHIILENNFENFLKLTSEEIMDELLKKIPESAEKRILHNDVFSPSSLPFYKKNMFDTCIGIIQKAEGGSIFSKVLIANMVRDTIVFSESFKINNFRQLYLELKNSIISTLFYCHLYGLIRVEYPERKISFSSLGYKFLFNDNQYCRTNQKGGLIINSDSSMVVIPEKVSEESLHILKSFTQIQDFDFVYNLLITRESLQEGILLQYRIEQFETILQELSSNEIPQNVKFLISEWTSDLPIINIEEGVVLLETTKADLMSIFLGYVKNKNIVTKVLSDKAILIEKKKIPEVIEITEKLKIIVKLKR